MLERTCVQGIFCIWAVSFPSTGVSHTAALLSHDSFVSGISFGQILLLQDTLVMVFLLSLSHP